jgi:RND superfamily putative drug exporter
VNLDRGGDAARIVVMKDGNPSRAGDPLRKDLVREADRLADDIGGVARVGGPAATLQDFDGAATSRLPILIITLVLVTYLALLPTLRSVVLPLIAVVLNVLTVAAAFGVLALLFGVPGAPLGGTGDLDGIMVLAIFGIVFGLSIDYEVFLLARMREGYALTGTTTGAVEYGLRKTAGVITGAALIMTGVFVAFALSPIASMQQLGIGLTTAVLLDATVVRLVLLPAIVKLCSNANWWLPGWLDRVLPELDIEGEAPGATPGSNGNGHRDGHGTVPDDIREAILAARRERETERIA